MTTPLWQPEQKAIADANLTRFIAFAHDSLSPIIADYDSLYTFSINNPSDFWTGIWKFCAVSGDMGTPPYLTEPAKMPGAAYFPGARLNFAQNLLSKSGQDDALVFWGEDKVRRRVSWDQLRQMAAGFQAHFKAAGIKSGDRVGAILPNMPETIAAMLGAAAMGAVWSSCSPDFGVTGVLDRFGQIEPSVLIACDGYYYNGKVINIGEKLGEISARLASLKQTIIIPYLGEAESIAASLPEALAWGEESWADAPAEPDFTPLPFSHPLYILFSSGTTGVPKCIVHSAGGTLLQHLKEQVLHCDIKPGERLFYFTTCGWMMWNWLASGLASGATLLLYDGSPFYPDGNVLFDLADAEGMNIFGTSAKYLDALKKQGYRPWDSHDLSSVRMLTSTGSPLAPEGFDYVHEAVKPDVHLASISGGTDIVSCFVLGNPLKPVWGGEIQGPGLAMAVDVVDDEGRHLGQGKGELVCRAPFPSMPIGFWRDGDGQKYHAAYFSRFANMWCHGDFAEWTAHGGIIIHGRSDATLNPGGVRIGTAEIYRQVEKLDAINESIVIGQEWDNDVRVVLFVVLSEGYELTDELRQQISATIRSGASPRHVPAKIIAVQDIPRTKSGKITELAVRDIVHGREIKNREALANPEALALFEDLPDLVS